MYLAPDSLARMRVELRQVPNKHGHGIAGGPVDARGRARREASSPSPGGPAA
jgi:hypothetical protein